MRPATHQNPFLPEHWRQKAIEARALAAEMRTPEGRLAMLEVAAACERMATLAAAYRLEPQQ